MDHVSNPIERCTDAVITGPTSTESSGGILSTNLHENISTPLSHLTTTTSKSSTTASQNCFKRSYDKYSEYLLAHEQLRQRAKRYYRPFARPPVPLLKHSVQLRDQRPITVHRTYQASSITGKRKFIVKCYVCHNRTLPYHPCSQILDVVIITRRPRTKFTAGKQWVCRGCEFDAWLRLANTLPPHIPNEEIELKQVVINIY